MNFLLAFLALCGVAYLTLLIFILLAPKDWFK